MENRNRGDSRTIASVAGALKNGDVAAQPRVDDPAGVCRRVKSQIALDALCGFSDMVWGDKLGNRIRADHIDLAASAGAARRRIDEHGPLAIGRVIAAGRAYCDIVDP